MAYSTVAQAREFIKVPDSTDLPDLEVQSKIALADIQIKVALSNHVDFTLVNEITETPATPDYINLLSRYKTCELCLVSVHGFKRTTEQITDIQGWQKEYDKLLKSIIDGKISLVDSAGNSVSKGNATFSNDAKPDINPAFGVGKYGEFESNSGIVDLDNRDPDGNDDE